MKVYFIIVEDTRCVFDEKYATFCDVSYATVYILFCNVCFYYATLNEVSLTMDSKKKE